jgi:ornithine carbamoyltransferase
MTGRSFLDVTDLSTSELVEVLDRAERPVEQLGRPLAGSGVALIFEKPSNRTRQSMEIAVMQLGGHPVYTRGDEIGFDTREPVEDIARIMDGYHAMLAARVFDHATVARLAAAARVPVVNMLSDRSHPMQALADVLTMRQRLGPLSGKVVAFVGDYNNVARSLGEASVMLGMHVRIASPSGFGADAGELERIADLGAGSIVQLQLPLDAVDGAHAVHTDTWVSMGQESDKDARRRAFEGFTVDAAMMAAADPGAVFMHCMPAYRGFEVAHDVIDGPQSAVYQQGHNRLHASRGLLSFLADARRPERQR